MISVGIPRTSRSDDMSPGMLRAIFEAVSSSLIVSFSLSSSMA